MTEIPITTGNASEPQLVRDVGLREATALNVIDMIGVGPFITIPLIISAMHGPQAMLGWIVGALLAMCDGLVWAELGASMPKAGGSYEYLKQSYGAQKLGRMMSFLFVWQLLFSAPLSIASGCVGLARYAVYVWPSLGHVLINRTFSLFGVFPFQLLITFGTFVAMAVCLLALFLLYRRIAVVGSMARYLSAGVLGAILLVTFAGLTHFKASLAFNFPPNAFAGLTHGSGLYDFLTGLGAAMLVATYDYWGYYNVGFIGGEIRQPERNIPRAIIYSILLVGTVYIVMNISILGVVPGRNSTQRLLPKHASTWLLLFCSERLGTGSQPLAPSLLCGRPLLPSSRSCWDTRAFPMPLPLTVIISGPTLAFIPGISSPMFPC